ncbi:hypothetical protein [Nitrincola tapanii]|uniref:Uncharacterized protein n=1 Tax=Nitrincola tapanii TaxID=1708751 RepID=A0A5A9W4R7_9GAMM|nr:hypothetical protein [Nitrincola tapanii]KAA0875145.1 hypothetical protein E1H14_06915 [Nitrincola tapanii]
MLQPPSRLTSRLLSLTLLGLLLFTPPLLLLLDRPSSHGLSWLPAWLFLIWLGLIGLAAWILERQDAQ